MNFVFDPTLTLGDLLSCILAVAGSVVAVFKKNEFPLQEELA